MDDPVLTARELVRDRFPAARAAFLAGSVLTDRRTPTSYLDIVVLLDGPPAPNREDLQYRGGPVELFVQTEAVWHSFADQETAKRNSPLLAMRSEGMLLVDTNGLGRFAPAEARERWAAGPPPLSDREREYQRYILTDLLDDLRGCADLAERVHLGRAPHPPRALPSQRCTHPRSKACQPSCIRVETSATSISRCSRRWTVRSPTPRRAATARSVFPVSIRDSRRRSVSSGH